MTRRRWWVVIAVGAATTAAGACSSDPGGGAGDNDASGGTAGASGEASVLDATADEGAAGGPVALAESCHVVCDKIVAAGCSQEGTLPACRSSCVNEYKTHEQSCTETTYPLLDCLSKSASYECSPDGFALPSGCDATLEAYAACSACMAAPGDAPCEICSQASCCSERQAAFGVEGAAAALRCQALCTDASCEAACLDAPAVKVAFDALDECQATLCAASCGG